MPAFQIPQKLNDPRSPLRLLADWPRDQPVVMLHSCREHARWARWSILARPRAFESSTTLPDSLGSLRHAPTPESAVAPSIPFIGGWIGSLRYELGHVFEPVSVGGGVPSPRPLVELGWCPDALVFDHRQGQWWSVGDPLVPAPGGGDEHDRYDLEFPRSLVRADDHLRAVARVKEYIRAGDVFQVNLTQPLRSRFNGSTRAIFADAARSSGAWYGAYIEQPDGRAIVSMSPELFLQVDTDRSVITRPIKGTRPTSAAPAELLASAKDAAELHMIVDLMRNDLGRVCEYGSVRVTSAREIETHPSIHHGVATIRGRLRADVPLAELIGATFPPGSVTGAPKIRAMQIIAELERTSRGPYCGAIGFFSGNGAARLSVAIRTAIIEGERRDGDWSRLRGELTYGVGGGIVADSEPAAEQRECMDKAAVLRALVTHGGPAYADLRSGSSARDSN